jgi:hypothetical protein
MAINHLTGIGNYDSQSAYCQFGIVDSYTCSRDDAYVEAYVYTDADYPISSPPATSSIFLAKVNFYDSASYLYHYHGTISGSVTNLQVGSFSDYYIQIWWGSAGDLLYTWGDNHTCSIDDNGQWNETSTGGYTNGYKFALLRSVVNHNVWSMCAVYPVGVLSPQNTPYTGSYVSPGVDGYFCQAGPYPPYGNYTDYSWFETINPPSRAKLSKLRLKSGGTILATTNDGPLPSGDGDLFITWIDDDE